MASVPTALGGDRDSLARAVHDLRSTLTVIRGLCFVLQRAEPRAERRRHLELIDGEVDRIARGLERLLAPPASPLACVCLGGASVAAAERHRPAAARHGVAVTVRAPRAPVHVRADADDMARVLDNLIANAVRHSPRAGEVRLTVRRSAGAATVTVRDQGDGISPGDRERIFCPGERGTTPRGEGQGLGLAIARELTERHGGRLESPCLGPGAAFRVRLPLADPADVAPQDAA